MIPNHYDVRHMRLASANRIVVLAVVALAAGLLLASGPGHRFGLWPYGLAVGLVVAAGALALAGAALALAGLAIPRLRAGFGRSLAFGLASALAVAYAPLQFAWNASAVPPIHDISTDTDDPPAFVAVVPLRAGSANGPEYDGPQAAALQHRAYPDIQPLRLAAPVQVTYDRALDAARAMGWEIVMKAPAEGRIEATATTRWFGFKDDIVIRITAEGTGSRIDVRSKSRVGRSDVGANARRIRAFLANLRG